MQISQGATANPTGATSGRSAPPVSILGPVSIVDANGRRTIVSGKVGLTLAMLAAAHPNGVAKSRLAFALWGDDQPKAADATLRMTMSRARRLLDESGHLDAIVTEASAYRLAIEQPATDHQRFVSLGVAADAARADGRHGDAASLLAEALDLWRGEPFDGLAIVGDLAVDAAMLTERRHDAQEALVDSVIAIGDHHRAVRLAARHVDELPYREHRWAQLMLALYRAGRQRDALTAFQKARQTLVDELGLDPGPLLVDLERRILEHDLAGSDPAPQPASPVPPATRASMPSIATSFVGRAREIDELTNRIVAPGLVTVHGPAGVGKSRLVIEALAGSDRRVDVIALGGTEPEGLARDVAQHRSLRLLPDADPFEPIAEHYRQTDAILVLDNAEHLADEVASLAERLVRECPSMTLVVTSRTVLGLHDERRFGVDPLGHDAAFGLLVERAGQRGITVDDDVATHDLVDHIDRLPLAIELAANQLRVLTPTELVDSREGDAVGLDETIARSYRLLDDTGRAVFEAVAGLQASFTAHDVAALAGLTMPDARSAIADLVDASMVVAEPRNGVMWFRLLRSLRRFGAAQLDRSGQTELVADRRAVHIAGVIASATVELKGRDERLAVDQIEQRVSEIRPALHRLIATGDHERATRLAIDVWDFAFQRFRFDLYDAAALVLTMPGVEDHEGYAGVLASAGVNAWIANEHIEARSLAERSLAAAEASGVSAPIEAHQVLSAVAGHFGDVGSGIVHAMKVMERAEADDDPYWRTNGYVTAAIGLAFLGGIGDALDFANRAVTVADATGNPSSQAWARYGLGVASMGSDLDHARASLLEAIRIGDSVRNRWIVAFAQTALTTVFRRLDRPADAARAIVAANRLWAQGALRGFLSSSLAESGLLLHRDGQHDLARWAFTAAATTNPSIMPHPDDQAAIDAARADLGLQSPGAAIRPVDHDLVEALADGLAMIVQSEVG